MNCKILSGEKKQEEKERGGRVGKMSAEQHYKLPLEAGGQLVIHRTNRPFSSREKTKLRDFSCCWPRIAFLSLTRHPLIPIQILTNLVNKLYGFVFQKSTILFCLVGIILHIHNSKGVYSRRMLVFLSCQNVNHRFALQGILMLVSLIHVRMAP